MTVVRFYDDVAGCTEIGGGEKSRISGITIEKFDNSQAGTIKPVLKGDKAGASGRTYLLLPGAPIGCV
jgi:hypothetical protein